MLTGKQIIDLMRGNSLDYQHLSPAYTQAVVRYVEGLEEVAERAKKVNHEFSRLELGFALTKLRLALKQLREER